MTGNAAIRQLGAEFVRREVAPYLQDWEDAGSIPRELHRAAGKQGLLGIAFPTEVGGEGGDLMDSVELQEAMLEAGASSGLMAGLFTSGIALPHLVADWAATGNAGLIDRFVRPTLAGDTIGALAVTEPGGGSDVAGLRTTAVRDGEHYVVNGAKTFITSGVRADFVTTAVRTGGSAPSLGRHAGLSLLVVEAGTPGFTVDRSLRKMGWHCSDTAELSFVDVRVPVANLVGEENSGFYQIAEQFVVERIALAVHAYGIAARSLELTAAYCRERETFGKPLIANQVVRHTLVEMRRQVEVARTYARAVTQRHAAGENVVAEACLAKQTACDAATYVCDKAVQLHGCT
jgi:acyl-CoA dehydrogenase